MKPVEVCQPWGGADSFGDLEAATPLEVLDVLHGGDIGLHRRTDPYGAEHSGFGAHVSGEQLRDRAAEGQLAALVG
jgi:hypothetical protein